MPSVLLEACCQSPEGALSALGAGADRVEFSCSLALGGLTPSPGSLETLREQTSAPIFCMVRPREGGFAYTREELLCMERDARRLIALGADGLVFGCLGRDGFPEEDALRRLLDASGGRPCVFHRALDLVPDFRPALDTLMRLGFARVLTSGGARTAMEGAITLRAMREHAGDALEGLPAAGIGPENAVALLRATGLRSLHLSGKRVRDDPSFPEGGPAFGLPGESGGSFLDTDPAVFRAVRRAVDAWASSPGEREETP